MRLHRGGIRGQLQLHVAGMWMDEKEKEGMAHPGQVTDVVSVENCGPGEVVFHRYPETCL